MSNCLWSFIFLGGLLGFMSLMFVFVEATSRRKKRKMDEAWQAFASLHPELRYESTDPTDPEEGELTGTYRGVPVRVATALRHNGENPSYLITIFEAQLTSAMPDDLTMHQKDWIYRLTNPFGTNDIETGDPTFDRMFVIHAAHADEAQSLLADPVVRAHLARACKKEQELAVVEQVVTVTMKKIVMNGPRLQQGLDVVTDAALALEDAARTAVRT
ncbi:MAG: hypothetical protein ACODAU_04465 [Myxococcota bacterium]